MLRAFRLTELILPRPSIFFTPGSGCYLCLYRTSPLKCPLMRFGQIFVSIIFFEQHPFCRPCRISSSWFRPALRNIIVVRCFDSGSLMALLVRKLASIYCWKTWTFCLTWCSVYASSTRNRPLFWPFQQIYLSAPEFPTPVVIELVSQRHKEGWGMVTRAHSFRLSCCVPSNPIECETYIHFLFLLPSHPSLGGTSSCSHGTTRWRVSGSLAHDPDVSRVTSQQPAVAGDQPRRTTKERRAREGNLEIDWCGTPGTEEVLESRVERQGGRLSSRCTSQLTLLPSTCFDKNVLWKPCRISSRRLLLQQLQEQQQASSSCGCYH